MRIESKIFYFEIIDSKNIHISEVKGGLISSVELDLEGSLWLKFEENFHGGYARLVEYGHIHTALFIPHGKKVNGFSLFEWGLSEAIARLDQFRLIDLHKAKEEGACSGNVGTLVLAYDTSSSLGLEFELLGLGYEREFHSDLSISEVLFQSDLNYLSLRAAHSLQDSDITLSQSNLKELFEEVVSEAVDLNS